MKKHLTRWFQKSSINPRVTLAIALVWVGALVSLHMFFPTRSIEARVIAPLLFKVRESLGYAPKLDPKIKVFGFDDVTAAKLDRTELTLEEWSHVLTLIDRSHPRGIVIDGLFSLANASKTPEGRTALARLQAIKTPIYTGLFAADGEIQGRVPIDLSDAAFNLSSYLDRSIALPGTRDEQLAKLTIADFQRKVIYGPHPTVRSVFNKAGHILYGEDEGSYLPFLRLKEGKAVPYLMFRLFGNVNFVQDRLFVDGVEIFLAKDGTSPINFLSRKTMGESVKSIWPLVKAGERNVKLGFVGEEDFVYVVPLFHTGSADFKPSPIGLIPGAFAHLAVLNSILQKSQLHSMGIDPILVIAFAAAIAYFGWWMSPSTLVLALIGASLAWVAACVGGFVYQSLILPFLLPQLSMLGVGVSLLLQRIYIAERKARMIRNALEGVVRPEALKALQRNPEKLSLEARERVITVVFIDIVGFSLMVENQLPRVAFEGLQSLVETMTGCIHKHGGIVNKTLGDGLLCFFGYSLEENKEIGNHAQEALAAALEIQTSNIPRILAAEGRRDPVFPLRIGINTSAVFMGNLGAGERLDITVIGNGVNFAKRLEAACLPHAVLIGSTTFDLVRQKPSFGTGQKRSIVIKHHEEEMDAFEFDPMAEDPGLRARVEKVYDLSAEAHRRIKRWDMDATIKIGILSPHGLGSLTHCSRTGVKFVLDAMIVRGTVFEAALNSPDGKLQSQLGNAGIGKVKFEVVTVEIIEARYVHAARFVELTAEQAAFVSDLLETFAPRADISLIA